MLQTSVNEMPYYVIIEKEEGLVADLQIHLF